jgi:hypothetical protein
MTEMKSAREKAMEKVEKMGKPSEEELKRMEYIPMGNTLAAKFLNDENFNLDGELMKHKGSGMRQFIIQGVMEIFVRNIVLPHDEREKNSLQRALNGIKLVLENKKQLDVVYDRITNLMNYYEQARQQAFQQFKKSFEAKIQENAAALQQQAAKAGIPLEVQLQTQFQEEWRKAGGELDAQYNKALDDQKQQILKIT